MSEAELASHITILASEVFALKSKVEELEGKMNACEEGTNLDVVFDDMKLMSN